MNVLVLSKEVLKIGRDALMRWLRRWELNPLLKPYEGRDLTVCTSPQYLVVV